MEGLSSALAVLSAMITPALLVSACGTMILSTSTRLGRVVDRVRDLTDRLEEMARSKQEPDLFELRRAMTFDQLDRLTSRSRLLQRSLTLFYMAVGIFVATSVAIGIVAISSRHSLSIWWVPVGLGMTGACFLFYGSMLLIFEARLALRGTYAEMDFLWRLGKHYVPTELVEQQKSTSRSLFRTPK